MTFLTPLQVADMLKVDDDIDREAWVIRRCRKGLFPGAKNMSKGHGMWRIPASGVEAFMAADVPVLEVVEPAVSGPVSVLDGLSDRSRRRVVRAS